MWGHSFCMSYARKRVLTSDAGTVTAETLYSTEKSRMCMQGVQDVGVRLRCFARILCTDLKSGILKIYFLCPQGR